MAETVQKEETRASAPRSCDRVDCGVSSDVNLVNQERSMKGTHLVHRSSAAQATCIAVMLGVLGGIEALLLATL